MKLDYYWTIGVRDPVTGIVAELHGSVPNQPLSATVTLLVTDLTYTVTALTELAEGETEQPIGATVGGIC